MADDTFDETQAKDGLMSDFLYGACADPQDEDCRRSSALFCSFNGMGLVLYLCFLPAVALTSNTFLLIIGTLTGLAHGLNMFFARRTKRLDVANVIGVSVLGVFLILVLVWGGVDNTGYLWTYIFPPIPMFVLGHRRGFWVDAVFLLLVAAVVFQPFEALVLADYSLGMKVRLLATLFFVAGVAYFFERAREQSARRLNAEVAAHRMTAGDLRLAKESAERHSQAKGDYLASMSHEIRTPLNGVVGTIHLLLNGDLDAGQKRLAESARKAAGSLLTVVDGVLDLARIENDKIAIESAPLDLGQLLVDVVDVFAPRAAEKGISLTCEIDRRMPARLLGDSKRVRQVVANLLGNAVKFTARGGVHIKARTDAMDQRGVVAHISIIDTGIGVTEAEQGQVFQVFTQAHQSTARNYGGSGLGLSICSKLVGMMDGQIGIDSDGQSGSTFWFKLPMAWAVSEQGDQPRL